MPNHIKNVLTFKHLKEDEKKMLLNAIANKMEDDSLYAISFNKIIPEPETKEECPKECIIESARRAGISEDERRPWFNWYDWHCAFWGTKWGAYDCYTEISEDSITFVFSTAWSYPSPIIEKLKLFGLDFELKYADEDLGSNCGRIVYSPKETGYLELITFEGDSTFAENLWIEY